LELVDLSIIGL